MTPQEVQRLIAQQARSLRLVLNLSQKALATKLRVSHGPLKQFERTGQISLGGLLKLSLMLGCIDKFKSLFAGIPVIKRLNLGQKLVDVYYQNSGTKRLMGRLLLKNRQILFEDDPEFIKARLELSTYKLVLIGFLMGYLTPFSHSIDYILLYMGIMGASSCAKLFY